MASFAEKLKRAREQAGMTQEGLSKKLHVSRVAVANWEIGRSEPSDKHRELIEQVLPALRHATTADAELRDSGTQLREARETAKWSRSDLSRRSRISVGTIAWIEDGKTRNPRRKTLNRLFAALSDKQLSWEEAIRKVLRKNGEPMRCSEIAKEIASQRLRTDLGATPASTVNATISVSIGKLGRMSPFARVKTKKGFVELREPAGRPGKEEEEKEDEAGTGLIKAFGMYWRRDKVSWKANPRLLGKEKAEGQSVDFAAEKGVYLLHDGREVVYAGKALDHRLGERLRAHNSDRLSGRWDRFTWFGICQVSGSGKLDTEMLRRPSDSTFEEILVNTMEGLLIEALEPRQNRRVGDKWGSEYIQAEDPQIEKGKKESVLDELKKLLQERSGAD